MVSSKILGFEPDAQYTERINNIVQFIHKVNHKNNPSFWGGQINETVKVVAARMDPIHPAVAFTFKTDKFMTNMFHSTHGGCVTTVADNLSTYAIFSDPRYWKEYDAEDDNTWDVVVAATKEMGVSRNLNVTFVRPMPLDTEVLLITKVHGNFTRYIHLTFEFLDPVTGKQFAIGSHDKSKPPQPSL